MTTMGHPYAYLALWNEYQQLHDVVMFEWENFGWIDDTLYFKYIEAERRWKEATNA
jgi:hypothetical protein